MRTLFMSLSLLLLAHLATATGTTTSPWPAQHECPTIKMETPAQVVCHGAELTFTASVEGVAPGIQQTFKWTVSTGKIKSGQGTPTITVATEDASPDAAFQGIRATVEVGGLNAGCSNTASHAVQVSAFCPDRKFDEFGELSSEEEQARLESFIARLQSEPDTLGYIRAYAGRCESAGETYARLERIRNYLVNLRGLDDRIATKDEGCQEEDQAGLRIELWVMPTKQPQPVPAPNINLKEVQNSNP